MWLTLTRHSREYAQAVRAVREAEAAPRTRRGLLSVGVTLKCTVVSEGEALRARPYAYRAHRILWYWSIHSRLYRRAIELRAVPDISKSIHYERDEAQP